VRLLIDGQQCQQSLQSGVAALLTCPTAQIAVVQRRGALLHHRVDEHGQHIVMRQLPGVLVDLTLQIGHAFFTAHARFEQPVM
jgi:hypothetical protein